MKRKEVDTPTIPLIVLFLFASTITVSEAFAANQGFAFTYQGELSYDDQPIDDLCDLTFSLYDASSGGNEVASQSLSSVILTAGLFTVKLGYGDIYEGTQLYLQLDIAAGCGDAGAAAETLPRSPVTSAPYASYAQTSALTEAVDWVAIQNRPAGLDDGDDDTQPTTYSAGTGLALSSGSFSLAPSYRLPQGCGSGQIPGWNGSAWTCSNDQNSTGFWSLGGTAGTNPLFDYIGTSDNQAFEIRVNGVHALRFEPNIGDMPNIIGGYYGNYVNAGVMASTIGGGGVPYFPNFVSGILGTVSGGGGNSAGQEGTVAGGSSNTASEFASVGGGFINVASGEASTISGGDQNVASGNRATIGGGHENLASGAFATVIGGGFSDADGPYSTAGGYYAQARLRGQRAFASHGFGASPGAAQSSAYTLSNVTVDALSKKLYLDGTGSTLLLTIPEDMTMTFDIQVTGSTSGGVLVAGYRFEGVAQNYDAINILQWSNKSILHEDVLSWDANLSANDINGSLDIVVTGEAGQAIRWVATVRTTEVIFP